MVGYEFESKFLNQSLASTRGSSLWWVSPERPTRQHNLHIERMRSVTYIHGPNAEFEAFFGKLALNLLRPPILGETTGPFVDNTQRPDIPSGPAVLSTTTSSSDENLEIEYLQKQLTRSQNVLYRLKQAVIPGVKNVRIQAQIEYQKQQIIKFGDVLRNTSSNKSRLIELIEQISQSIRQTGTDPKTISYLESLINNVKEAYSEGHPNQDIISGSISAIILIANRLGSEIVKPDLVRELRSFAHLATM